jgi:hypothetical protein
MTMDMFRLSQPQSHQFSFMIYHPILSKSNTTVATSGDGIAYPSEVPKFIHDYNWVPVARSLVFYVVFCRPLYCLSFIDLRQSQRDSNGIVFTFNATLQFWTCLNLWFHELIEWFILLLFIIVSTITNSLSNSNHHMHTLFNIHAVTTFSHAWSHHFTKGESLGPGN